MEGRFDQRASGATAHGHSPADVAGYSRLVGADEEGTLAQWKAHWRALIEPKIKEYSGRIVRITGDGLLVEFTSVIAAVRCAVEVQRTMVKRNADVPQERRIEFRMGINVDDIIIEARDIFGDGVNIAARLEAWLSPAVFASPAGSKEVHGRLNVVFEDTGEHKLKNISRPIRVYRLRPNGTAANLTRAARQAVDRRAAVPEHERRSGAGIFRRRHGGGHHHGAIAHALAVRDRAQFELHLQGPGRRREAGRSRARRALRARRQRAQGGEPGAHHGAAHRCVNRGTSLGGPLRWRARGHLRLAGSGDHERVGAIAPQLEQAEIERAKRKPTESLDAYDYFLRGMASCLSWTERASARRWRCSTRPSNSTPISPRPMAWRHGATSGVRSTAG